jgi:hypothetical protein
MPFTTRHIRGPLAQSPVAISGANTESLMQVNHARLAGITDQLGVLFLYTHEMFGNLLQVGGVCVEGGMEVVVGFLTLFVCFLLSPVCFGLRISLLFLLSVSLSLSLALSGRLRKAHRIAFVPWTRVCKPYRISFRKRRHI